MLEFVKAGGWMMLPILLCSVIATAIVVERFWSLQRRRITPDNLVAQVWQWSRAGVLDDRRVQGLRAGSPLGRVLAAGLVNRFHDRAVMKEGIEEVGRHVAHELGRYLNTLGTVAAITPLLGLLGTVFGMITVFTVITVQGIGGDAAVLAGGISEALITTAAGLSVAIPTLMFYRYFSGRVEAYVVTMEQEALSWSRSWGAREQGERADTRRRPMNFRPAQGRDIDINLTPLIDVVFLLPIFFMVSTTFVKESKIDLTLPEASRELREAEPAQIVVAIDRAGGCSRRQGPRQRAGGDHPPGTDRRARRARRSDDRDQCRRRGQPPAGGRRHGCGAPGRSAAHHLPDAHATGRPVSGGAPATPCP